MRVSLRVRTLLVVAFGAGWFACGGCSGKATPSKPAAEEPADPRQTTKPTEAQPKPEPKPATGTLTGTIRLAPGHELPVYAPEQMERKVLAHIERGTFPDVCTPPKLVDRTPVRQTQDGKLSGVMVAASEFSRSEKRAPMVHELSIRDCRLTPPLVVATEGDTLRIKNEVSFPFMPGYGNDAYATTLSPGQHKDVPLDKGGVQPVLCGFTAPCGRSDVVVVFHSVYAVTGEDGSFRLENFPADETIKVNAWHPLFQASELTVRVERGAEKHVELILTPQAPASAPPADAAKPSSAPQQPTTKKPAAEKPANSAPDKPAGGAAVAP